MKHTSEPHHLCDTRRHSVNSAQNYQWEDLQRTKFNPIFGTNGFFLP